MNCTRCGAAGVVVTKGDESFCASCATIRDWQELIGLIQDAQVSTPVAGGDTPRLQSV
jgi:hypothetical protein